jgi:transcriptional regulator of acetoin/glycerol metabolism
VAGKARGGEERDGSGGAKDREVERLRREIERARGNLAGASRALGIPRSTLRYRLGLDDPAARARRNRARRISAP